MTSALLVLRSLVCVAVPLTVLLGGGALMNKASARVFPSEGSGEPLKPLNQRYLGYDTAAVTAYFDGLGTGKGKEGERRFLEFDLVFPTVFAAALVAGLWMSAKAAGQRRPPLWAVGLIVIGLVADWTENLTQLRLLDAPLPLDDSVVNQASSATIVKLWTETLVIVVIAAYAVAAVRRGRRLTRGQTQPSASLFS